MKSPRWSLDVMAVPLGRLEEAFKAVEGAGCHELHFDVMDGAFAPDFSLGAEFVTMAKAACGLPCDVHLLTEHPERHIKRFAEAGADSLSVHVEACIHDHRALQLIRDMGFPAGIAILPATPLTKLEYLLPSADRIVVLASDAGLGNRPVIANAHDRVKILRENLDYRKSGAKIQVEGHLDAKAAAAFVHHGADIVVVGTGAGMGSGSAGEALGAFAHTVDQALAMV